MGILAISKSERAARLLLRKADMRHSLLRTVIHAFVSCAIFSLFSGCGSDGAGAVSDPDGSAAALDASGGSHDAATSDAARHCVNIDPASFDDSRSCNDDGQCVGIWTGALCNGDCACGPKGAINKSALDRYNATYMTVQRGFCSCSAGGLVRCIANACVVCPSGGGGVCGDQ